MERTTILEFYQIKSLEEIVWKLIIGYCPMLLLGKFVVSPVLLLYMAKCRVITAPFLDVQFLVE